MIHAARQARGGLTVMANKVVKSEDEWKRALTPAQYAVCRQKGTERAFTGPYWDHHADGTYRCVACSEPLFSSDAKFDSGTGWPSFTAPLAPSSVATVEDVSHGMRRVEVVLRCLRLALGTRLSRRAAPNRRALLHDGLGEPRLRTQEVTLLEERP